MCVHLLFSDLPGRFSVGGVRRPGVIVCVYIFIDLPGRFSAGGERRPGAGSAGGPAGKPHAGPACSSAQASASRTAWAPAVARSGTSASAPTCTSPRKLSGEQYREVYEIRANVRRNSWQTLLPSWKIKSFHYSFLQK